VRLLSSDSDWERARRSSSEARAAQACKGARLPRNAHQATNTRRWCASLPTSTYGPRHSSATGMHHLALPLSLFGVGLAVGAGGAALLAPSPAKVPPQGQAQRRRDELALPARPLAAPAQPATPGLSDVETARVREILGHSGHPGEWRRRAAPNHVGAGYMGAQPAEREATLRRVERARRLAHTWPAHTWPAHGSTGACANDVMNELVRIRFSSAAWASPCLHAVHSVRQASCVADARSLSALFSQGPSSTSSRTSPSSLRTIAACDIPPGRPSISPPPRSSGHPLRRAAGPSIVPTRCSRRTSGSQSSSGRA
jgi:hypothetical protein